MVQDEELLHVIASSRRTRLKDFLLINQNKCNDIYNNYFVIFMVVGSVLSIQEQLFNTRGIFPSHISNKLFDISLYSSNICQITQELYMRPVC